MRRGAAVLLLAACACVVEAHPRPPPRVMPAPEAVAIATQLARSRGLVIDTTHAARLDRRARWHVDLGGAGGRDRALVTVDGFTGRVLGARLRRGAGELEGLPPPPPPEGAPAAPPPGMPPEPSAAPPPPPAAAPPPPAG